METRQGMRMWRLTVLIALVLQACMEVKRDLERRADRARSDAGQSVDPVAWRPVNEGITAGVQAVWSILEYPLELTH